MTITHHFLCVIAFESEVLVCALDQTVGISKTKRNFDRIRHDCARIAHSDLHGQKGFVSSESSQSTDSVARADIILTEQKPVPCRDFCGTA